ncbi:hypothetical protein ACFL0V_00800 [Nanoarchaeota archaeon]
MQEPEKIPQGSIECLDVRVLDLSQAVSNPGRVAYLIEEARAEKTSNPDSKLEDYISALEEVFLLDKPLLDELSGYLLATYMPSHERTGDSCGSGGNSYANREESAILGYMDRVKRALSGLAKAGDKLEGMPAVMQIGEASLAMEDDYQSKYSLTDVLAARFVVTDMQAAKQLVERLKKDSNLEVQGQEELKDKPDTGYQAYHLTLVVKGVAVDLHVMTYAAYKIAEKDRYHPQTEEEAHEKHDIDKVGINPAYLNAGLEYRGG